MDNYLVLKLSYINLLEDGSKFICPSKRCQIVWRTNSIFKIYYQFKEGYQKIFVFHEIIKHGYTLKCEYFDKIFFKFKEKIKF